MRGVLAIAGWEMRAAARSRWLVASAAVFGLATASVVLVGLRGARELGLSGAGPAAAGLVGVALLLPSLTGLVAASGSLASARERGELAMMLVQPLGRGALVAGSFTGLVSAVWAVSALGFAAAIVVVSPMLRAGDLALIAGLAGATLGLAASCVAIGVLISAASRGRAQATATGVAVWFLLAAGLDLLAATLLPALGGGAPVLLGAVLLNPVESARVMALLASGQDGAALGPFGSFLGTSLGTAGSVLILAGALAAWTVLPLVAAKVVISRRDA